MTTSTNNNYQELCRCRMWECLRAIKVSPSPQDPNEVSCGYLFDFAEHTDSVTYHGSRRVPSTSMQTKVTLPEMNAGMTRGDMRHRFPPLVKGSSQEPVCPLREG